MGFDEIFGNEPAKRNLINAIQNDHISNAYVLEGIQGIGKRLTAEIFARGLVCESRGAVPCDSCSACRKAKSYNHPDIVYLKKTGDKASIGVDDVREQILNEVYLKPYLSSRRVFVIGEGDALSIEAQNALLKILEEPPAYVTFVICVTKQDKLLNTVLSRCSVVAFFPLAYDEVATYLEKRFGANEKLRLCARLSQGSIGVAISLVSDGSTEQLYEDTVQAVLRLKKDACSVREMADFMITEKDRISQVIDFFQTFLRDCVFVKSGMELCVIYENKRSTMHVFCDGISKKGLISAFDRLTDFRLRLKQNLNYHASVSETVMRIWEDFHG